MPQLFSVSAANIQVAQTVDAEADTQVPEEVRQVLVWLSRRDCSLWLVIFSNLHTSPGQQQLALLPVFVYGSQRQERELLEASAGDMQLVYVRLFMCSFAKTCAITSYKQRTRLLQLIDVSTRQACCD